MPAIQVHSEIGKLRGVIIHPPGPEVENMTPGNAERALYSDILNLSVAGKEYRQLECLLEKVTSTFRVTDLLRDILRSPEIREKIIKKVCYSEGYPGLIDKLLALDENTLSVQLIQGVPLDRTTLSDYLSDDHFSLKPLHNFFFTRDASVAVGGIILVSKMASRIRARETLIMQAIYDYHPRFRVKTVSPDGNGRENSGMTIEGGDLIIASENIVLAGLGSRTNVAGIDFLIKMLAERKEKQHVLVQELPSKPESFIHLDMVFTILDHDSCMVFEPLILKSKRYQTIRIDIEGGKVVSIKNVDNLVAGLSSLGMHLKPSFCGGQKDMMVQEREQWHSGANFFAIGPGRLIGYNRNHHTLEDLNASGYEIIKSKDFLDGKTDSGSYAKSVLTIDGAELSRGGGGVRCMTMPFSRES